MLDSPSFLLELSKFSLEFLYSTVVTGLFGLRRNPNLHSLLYFSSDDLLHGIFDRLLLELRVVLLLQLA